MHKIENLRGEVSRLDSQLRDLKTSHSLLSATIRTTKLTPAERVRLKHLEEISRAAPLLRAKASKLREAIAARENEIDECAIGHEAWECLMRRNGELRAEEGELRAELDEIAGRDNDLDDAIRLFVAKRKIAQIPARLDENDLERLEECRAEMEGEDPVEGFVDLRRRLEENVDVERMEEKKEEEVGREAFDPSVALELELAQLEGELKGKGRSEKGKISERIALLRAKLADRRDIYLRMRELEEVQKAALDRLKKEREEVERLGEELVRLQKANTDVEIGIVADRWLAHELGRGAQKDEEAWERITEADLRKAKVNRQLKAMDRSFTQIFADKLPSLGSGALVEKISAVIGAIRTPT
jgi:hypothetical protein